MRGRHMRRFGIALGTVGTIGVLAASISASASASGPPDDHRTECAAHELPVPSDIGPDDAVVVRDADPSGRYVLAEVLGDESEPEEGLLWVDGELEARLTGLPDSDAVNEFRAVNGAGVVVGVSRDGWTPWKYQDGEYTALEGGADEAFDINENGDIVGTRYNASTVVWPAGDPTPVDLPGQYIAGNISDEGVVVGPDTYFFPDYNGTAYYWPDWDSEPQTLENPDGVRPIVRDFAGDWAIGHDVDDFDLGVRWNLADGTVEKLPYRPSAVNSAGDTGTDGAIHRADGTVEELPAPGDGTDAGALAVFEPGSSASAAGSYVPDNDDGYEGHRPVTWIC